MWYTIEEEGYNMGEIYHNDCNSLPQQVEINRDNIIKLHHQTFSNHVVATLMPNKWEPYHNVGNNGIKYVHRVEIYDITDTGIPILSPLSRDSYDYTDYSNIVFIESGNGYVEIYSQVPLSSNVDVIIYYTKE